jgi:hypothetical protein
MSQKIADQFTTNAERSKTIDGSVVHGVGRSILLKEHAVGAIAAAGVRVYEDVGNDPDNPVWEDSGQVFYTPGTKTLFPTPRRISLMADNNSAAWSAFV